MSNIKKMTLNDDGSVQWQDVGVHAPIRFELDNGQVIECKIEGDTLDVRTPEGRLVVHPKSSNDITVSAEML